MSLIIFAIVVLVIIVLLLWAVDQLGIPTPPANLVKVLIVLLGVVAIINRAGWL